MVAVKSPQERTTISKLCGRFPESRTKAGSFRDKSRNLQQRSTACIATKWGGHNTSQWLLCDRQPIKHSEKQTYTHLQPLRWWLRGTLNNFEHPISAYTTAIKTASEIWWIGMLETDTHNISGFKTKASSFIRDHGATGIVSTVWIAWTHLDNIKSQNNYWGWPIFGYIFRTLF